MDTATIIKNLGLSDQETEIYLALLRLGGSRASDVAKEIDIKRTTAYPLLKSLARKGFARVYFRDNCRYYYAQQPQRVSALFSKKVQDFDALIPRLQSLENKQVQVAGLRFIETLDELKEFYRTILIDHKNKEYKVIGSAVFWEGLDPDFFRQYRFDRAAANTRTKLLLSAESESVNPEDASLLRTVKFFPKKHSFKSTINIFNDQVLVVSPELSALAVLISVPAMTDVFSSIFDMLWDLIGDEI